MRARLTRSGTRGTAAPLVARDDTNVVIAVTPMLSALAAATAGRRGRPLGLLVQDLTGNAAAQSGATRAGAAGRIARLEHGLLRGADAVGVMAPRFGEVLRPTAPPSLNPAAVGVDAGPGAVLQGRRGATICVAEVLGAGS